ncbi:FAD-binding oxidoreductase [bacterium]|nr:FAD-binding oxidoreductase [bacterium]
MKAIAGSLLPLLAPGALAEEPLALSPPHPDYKKFCRWFNPACQFRPRAIVVARSAEEIVGAFSLARSQGWPVSLKCGGHSYVGLSGGDGLVLDVSRLLSLRIQGDRLFCGAGWRLGPLRTALAHKGWMLPLGQCPGVGLSGFLLGGGYGPTARGLGLGCDSILDAQMISPALGRVQASQSDDLLWALRGSGYGQFGAVFEWCLQLQPIQEVVVFRKPVRETEFIEELERWQHQAPRQDWRVTSYFHLGYQRASLVGALGGVFLGTMREWRRIGWQARAEAAQMPYLAAMNRLGGAVQKRLSPFRATSDFLAQPLSAQAIGALIDQLHKGASHQVQVTFDAYGGAIDQGVGAFPPRPGRLACVQALGFERGHPHLLGEWLSEYAVRLRPFYTGEAYANYAELGRKDWREAYFGSHWERLLSLKVLHDPCFLLRHPLSLIPLGTP